MYIALALAQTWTLQNLPNPSPAEVVAMARNGTFATGDKDGNVTVYDARGQQTTRFHDSGPITALAFSPDGKMIASGIRDDGSNVSTSLWSAGTGKRVRAMDGLKHNAPKSSDPNRMFSFVTTAPLAWSADGTMIAASHQGHMNVGVYLWSVDGKLVGELGKGSHARPYPMAASIKCLEFSPDGSRLVTGMDDGFVRLWRRDGSLAWQTKVDVKDTVCDADFSPDGRQIIFATSWQNKRIGWLDAKTGKQTGQGAGSGDFSLVRFVNNQQFLLSTGPSFSISEPAGYNEGGIAPLPKNPPLPGPVISLAFSGDRRTAIAAFAKAPPLVLHIKPTDMQGLKGNHDPRIRD